ncbi:MAG: mechanosensitive ion channel [Melioribacteraceae bacterium]|nr:mechanosensitive ion channel [Melioribacteraceae bacterium]
MKKIFTLSIIIFFLISFPQTIIAQDNSPKIESQEVEEIEYKPIAVIEIPQKIEEVSAFLKKINAVEIPATEIEKLKENFTTYLEEIEQLRKESTKEIFDNSTTKKLKDFNLKWNSHLVNIGDFKKQLQEASERLAHKREQLKRVLEYWELTHSNAKKEKAPKQLMQRLRDLKKEVEKTDKALFGILNKVLAIRDKVSIEEVATNETLNLIKIQIEENRSLIFTFDSQPIWIALTDSTDTTTFAHSLNSSTTRVISALVEFWDMYSEEFPYYIGFYFFVLLIILYLKRFGNKNVDQKTVKVDKYSIRILNKPFSIAILITIYFHLAFFPLAPSVIAELARILLVLPILFLFPTFISSTSRGPLYFITSIYLLQQIIELTIGSSIYLRVFTILLTALMITALYWFLKIDTSKIIAKRKKIIAALHVTSKLLIVILFISLFGNILGNTALSTLIFSGVMRTIYASIFLITSLQVAYTLLTILLETKAAKISYIVKRKRSELKSTLFSLVKVIAIFFWGKMFLMNFEIYDSISELFITIFTTPLELGSFSITTSSIALFFISIWLSTKFSKVTRFFFENEIFARVTLPCGVPAAISLMMNYTILTLGFLFALSVVGFDIEKFAIVAGALGVGIGFGLQSIVNNFISGLILLFERPIQVGDTISLTNNLLGTVKRIGIRASIVQTFDGSEVIVPNADLISGQVTNWTLSDSRRRIEIKIGVHFDADPDEVMNILNKALEDREDVLKEPKPYSLYKGYVESTQNFDLRFWTANNDNWIFIRSEILLKIVKMLNDAGIEIPYQQQNVYLKEYDKKKN